jgi:RNA recognition motif-containing protein
VKKLYVGNLPFGVEENQLRELFEGEGRKVASVQIITDRQTGRSRGFGFVEMESPEDGEKAIASINGQEFQGRALVVNEAREKTAGDSRGPQRTGGGFGGGRGGRNSGGGGAYGGRNRY